MKRLQFMVLSTAALLVIGFIFTSAGGSDRGSGTTQPGGRGHISVTVYDRGNIPAAEGTIENNRWTRWINENGPVDVTFVAIPRVRPEERLNVLFASRTAPDLIFEFAAPIKDDLWRQGMLMPIDEMIERYSTNYKEFLVNQPAIRRAATMPDGRMYHFGRTNLLNSQRVLLIREDWLENLGLNVPNTIEELFQVAKAFAEQDPDGNGIRDTYGMVLSSSAGPTIDQMFGATTWGIVNNEWVRTWERTEASLNFRKRLFDENIVDRDFLSDTQGRTAIQDLVNGRVGIFPWLMTNYLNFFNNEYATFRRNVPEGRLIQIPFPETQFGRFNGVTQNPVQLTAFVNADARNPEAIMRYVDFISSAEAWMTLNNGIEGVHFNMVNGIPINIDAQRRNQEVAWAMDYLMLISYETTSRFAHPTGGFDLSDPIQREGYNMWKNSFRMYLDPNLPFAEITHPEHWPQLPSDLALLNSGMNLGDIFNRALVLGPAYTAAQAMSDARAAWDRGGGRQIEAWYANWWRTESQNTFLFIRDNYEIIRQQDVYNRLP